MEEFSLKNFDELLKEVQDIKKDLAGDKVKAARKEKKEKIMGYVTFSIAVLSFILSIYSIDDNNKTDKRNYKFQRETQAYDFWLNYLDLASQHPSLANGKTMFDNIPVDSIACRDKYKARYEDTTVNKFIQYAWFVAKALGTAEIVSDLTKDDIEWEATIDAIIKNHMAYIASDCFEKKHYGEYIRKRIEMLLAAKSK